MSYLDHYVKRLKLIGDNATDAQIKRSQTFMDRQFETSPSYYKIIVDDNMVGAVVNRTNDPKEKKVHFLYDYEIDIGSVVLFKNHNYLVTEKDRDEVYNFAKMSFCNGLLKIETDRKREIIGYEGNRPIFDYVITYKDEPCVVDSKYYSSNENAQLPLPEGKLSILLKHQEIPNLGVNKVFHMFDKKYKVVDIGYTNVYQDVGFIEIIAERVVGESE